MQPKGPYTLWIDYGYEGWQPQDFETLEAALSQDCYGTAFVITAGPIIPRTA